MGVTSAIIGAVIGGFFGAVPLTSLGDTWPIPHQFGFGTLLAGVLIGALTGYVIGDARAFGYRLQAQSSLCQLHLERNTAALLADSYSAAPSIRPEPPPAPVFEYVMPEPEPKPAPEPAPVAEVHMPEYLQPEPEYLTPEPEFEIQWPEPELGAEPEPESLSFVNARLSANLASVPETAPFAAALVPEYIEPEPEPAPEPAPVPFAEAPALVPPRLVADAPPPDLDSMSLEEIAELAKTGLI